MIWLPQVTSGSQSSYALAITAQCTIRFALTCIGGVTLTVHLRFTSGTASDYLPVTSGYLWLNIWFQKSLEMRVTSKRLLRKELRSKRVYARNEVYLQKEVSPKRESLTSSRRKAVRSKRVYPEKSWTSGYLRLPLVTSGYLRLPLVTSCLPLVSSSYLW